MFLASRASDWRLSFIPFIIGCVYLWLFYFQIKYSTEAIILFVLSLVTSCGFASLGYFINEFFDKKSDAKAGKINRLALLPGIYQFLLFSATLSITILPWLVLPFDKFSICLISLEFFLFLIYSLPYPRFKEIALLSNLIDALYAYVVPLILAFHTYSLFAGGKFDSFILLFSITAFVIGFRNILIHQVNDVFKDKKSGIKTLPAFLGVYNTNLLIKLLIFFEFVLVNAFSIDIFFKTPLFLIWIIFFNLYFLIKLYRNRHGLSSIYISIQQTRHFTDHIYQIFFPLITLGLLLYLDYRWLLLLPLHLFFLVPKSLFENIKNYLLKMLSYAIGLSSRLKNIFFRILSTIVNYPIYYLFLLFGVDLKKENKSALEYLKSKWT